MIKMDNGTASNSKIFELNDQDIELIVRLLHQECDHHVYSHGDMYKKQLEKTYFKERYDHIQDLIIQLTK